MTIWRPVQYIRVKAIGICWRGDRLLAAEVTTDTGHIKGVRPLGGTVEFGETWQQALAREFQEELSIEITTPGRPHVLENIFTHEGKTGHEVIFAAEVTLPTAALPSDDPIVFKEDSGVECTARWFTLDELDTGGPALYPTGLKQVLLNATYSG
ncbi:NUDIX hydrolase [Phaeobacter sp. C3_T13_0]|uniref:NUDIX hydrolase n=1 Tax=Phaeobacter cretensis TaxID=3342641 RepID=UPI0039BCE026